MRHRVLRGNDTWLTRGVIGITGLVLLLAACTSTPMATYTPAAWESTDVGLQRVDGDVEEVGQNSLKVMAAGEDIWNTADAFHFVYKPLDGDGSLTVRVEEMRAVDEWTKAGLMVRESLDPSARNAFILLTDYNGVLFQRRESVGAQTGDVLPDGTYMRNTSATAPWWLKITRAGDTLIGSHSQDGLTWQELGRVNISLPQQVLIGMAVTSRRQGAVASATFSQIALEGHTVSAPEEPVTPPTRPNTGPVNSTTYQFDHTTDLLNPERGFHGEVNLLSGGGYDGLRAAGMTLARSYVRLDAYRNGPIPESVLSQLRSGLQGARNAGVKVIPRFTYNFGFEPDAPLNVVLTHIQQLEPILKEYSDVIAVLQAGFIGAWGEWHNSSNGLLNAGPKQQIADALLGAMPTSRMIQIRTPGLIRSVVGSPSPSTIQFGTSPQARVGFVNDCFVSDHSDSGTYLGDQTVDRAEGAALSRYTVSGGETCAIGFGTPINGCANSLAELTRFNFDYLNRNYYGPILDRWRSEGCFDEVRLRLGYRLGLLEGSVTQAVKSGETLTVNLRIQNSGFGKVYNPRPADIVLRNANTGVETVLRASGDLRQALPLAGETRDVELNVAVPAGLAAGTYQVLLRLPDPAPNLERDVRYNLRLANVGTWQASSGTNDLLITTTVGN